MRKLALFLFAAALTLPALAQNLRVSQPLADALGSGKYYMRLKMQSLDFGDNDDAESTAQMESMMSRMETEMACNGSSAMMRVNMSGASMVTLYAGGQAYRLDDNTRTYHGLKSTSWMLGNDSANHPRSNTNLVKNREILCVLFA